MYCNLTAGILTCENRTVHNPPQCMDCLDNDADTYYDYLGYNTTASGDPECASNLGTTETGGTAPPVPEFGTWALLIALGAVVAGVMMRRRA